MFADLPGKKRQGKNGKRGNGEVRKENCKKESVNFKMEGVKVTK